MAKEIPLVGAGAGVSSVDACAPHGEVYGDAVEHPTVTHAVLQDGLFCIEVSCAVGTDDVGVGMYMADEIDHVAHASAKRVLGELLH